MTRRTPRPPYQVEVRWQPGPRTAEYAATREQTHEFARGAGLVALDSVTKKLDVLVVADPQSASGKAKKARSYGTRIIAEAVFWQLIGVPVD